MTPSISIFMHKQGTTRVYVWCCSSFLVSDSDKISCRSIGSKYTTHLPATNQRAIFFSILVIFCLTTHPCHYNKLSSSVLQCIILPTPKHTQRPKYTPNNKYGHCIALEQQPVSWIILNEGQVFDNSNNACFSISFLLYLILLRVEMFLGGCDLKSSG